MRFSIYCVFDYQVKLIDCTVYCTLHFGAIWLSFYVRITVLASGSWENL